jgi:hypothetical protein
MEKTAMQIGIERIKDKIFEYDGMENAATCFHVAIDILTQLLPTEQQQITDAFEAGMGFPDADFYSPEKLENIKSDYFKTKYQ